MIHKLLFLSWLTISSVSAQVTVAIDTVQKFDIRGEFTCIYTAGKAMFDCYVDISGDSIIYTTVWKYGQSDNYIAVDILSLAFKDLDLVNHHPKLREDITVESDVPIYSLYLLPKDGFELSNMRYSKNNEPENLVGLNGILMRFKDKKQGQAIFKKIRKK